MAEVDRCREQDLVPLPDVDLIWIEARLRSLEKPQKTVLEGAAGRSGGMCGVGVAGMGDVIGGNGRGDPIVLTLLVWPVVFEE